jgi:hypothetical protein
MSTAPQEAALQAGDLEIAGLFKTSTKSRRTLDSVDCAETISCSQLGNTATAQKMAREKRLICIITIGLLDRLRMRAGKNFIGCGKERPGRAGVSHTTPVHTAACSSTDNASQIISKLFFDFVDDPKHFPTLALKENLFGLPGCLH